MIDYYMIYAKCSRYFNDALEIPRLSEREEADESLHYESPPLMKDTSRWGLDSVKEECQDVYATKVYKILRHVKIDDFLSQTVLQSVY